MGTAVARFVGRIVGVEWKAQEMADPQMGYMVAHESKDGRLTITLKAPNVPSAADVREALTARAETLFQAILSARPRDIIQASSPQIEALDFVPDRVGEGPVNHTVELSARMAHDVTLSVSIPESETISLSEMIVRAAISDARAEYAKAALANDPSAQFDAFYGLLTKLAKAKGCRRDDKYCAVDVHIRLLDPSVETSADPREKESENGPRETVYTRIRNQLHHPEDKVRAMEPSARARAVKAALPGLRELVARSLV
jgi:hypothetical protein